MAEKRYKLNFWKKNRAEPMQYDKVHYRDEGNNRNLTRLRHKTCLKMVWAETNYIPTVLARSAIINGRFSSTKSLIV